MLIVILKIYWAPKYDWFLGYKSERYGSEHGDFINIETLNGNLNGEFLIADIEISFIENVLNYIDHQDEYTKWFNEDKQAFLENVCT